MSEISGNPMGDVALLGQIAQEVGDYFVRIRRYEEALEEYEDAIIAYDRVAEGCLKTDETRKLRASAWERLNELKNVLSQQPSEFSDILKNFHELFESLNNIIAMPPFVPVSLTDALSEKIFDIKDVLKDILSPSIQWQFAFPLNDDEELKPVTLPGKICISGEKKGNQVRLDIGSAIMLSDTEQVSDEMLKKILQKLDSCEEFFYYQVLFGTQEDKWQIFPTEPEETDELEVDIPDEISDRFLLLLDTKKDNLIHSSETLIQNFNQLGKTCKVSSSTLIIKVEIQEGDEK